MLLGEGWFDYGDTKEQRSSYYGNELYLTGVCMLLWLCVLPSAEFSFRGWMFFTGDLMASKLLFRKRSWT